jgi:hypothetical protein
MIILTGLRLPQTVFSPLVRCEFHTHPYLLRKFEIWSAAAADHGFAPEEVLKASKLGAYVVIDPQNEDLLLPLSPSEYKALKGQCISNLKDLVVILSPLDEKSPAKGVHSDTPPQNSPHTEEDSQTASASSTSDTHPRVRKVLKALRKWYQGYWTHNLKIVDNRLAPGTDSGLLLTVLQSFSARVALWSGAPRRRVLRKNLLTILAFLVSIHRSSGTLGLSLYMKNSLFAIKSYIAGTPLKSTWALGHGVRLQHGLPRFIPIEIRRRIRARDPGTIRWISSILFAYKGLTVVGKGVVRSVSTITKPLPEIDRSGFWEFCKDFVPTHLIPMPERPCPEFFKPGPFPLSPKAGPNGPVAAFAIPADAAAWVERKKRTGSSEIETWLTLIGLPEVYSMIEDLGNAYLSGEYRYSYKARLPNLKSALKGFFSETSWKQIKEKIVDFSPLDPTSRGLSLGRLAFLPEAAGKVRVIAIVDSFRQWLLEPVHLLLFRLLKKFPSDATFDQTGALQEFSQRGYTHLFSYDLKSATDMIPRTLYLDALRPVLGDLTDAWLDLLVGVPFLYQDNDTDPRLKQSWKTIFYGRGQPMGALSSWGSLAFLHHMIVQYAFHVCVLDGVLPPQRGMFKDYLVLGDDLVIAHSAVAARYVEICETFDIPIGMSKSLISRNGCFEFASNFFSGAVNLSPASFREDLSVRTFSQRIALGMRLLGRGWLGEISSNASGLVQLLRRLVDSSTWRKYQEFLRQGRVFPALTRLVHAVALSRLEFLPGEGTVGAKEWFGSFDPVNLIALTRRGLSESTPNRDLCGKVLFTLLYQQICRLEHLEEQAENLTVWRKAFDKFCDEDWNPQTGYRLPFELARVYTYSLGLPPLHKYITGVEETPRELAYGQEPPAPYIIPKSTSDIRSGLQELGGRIIDGETSWEFLGEVLQHVLKAYRVPDAVDFRLCDLDLPFDFIMHEAVSLLRKERRSWNAQLTIHSTGDDSWIRLAKDSLRLYKQFLNEGPDTWTSF